MLSRRPRRGTIPGRAALSVAPLTLQQLERHLASAADILRGPSGGRDALEMIAVLLLLKHCSDQAAAGEDGGLRVPEQARWEYLRDRISRQDPGGAVTGALRALEDANPGAGGLAACPGGARADTLPPGTLAALVRCLDRYRLRRSDLEFPDLPGAAYERLLGELSARGGPGAEYYTPPGVAALIAGLASPAPGGSVYDPCCGSGGLLLAAAAHAPGITLHGQDLSPQAVTAARVNMILHGAGPADLRCGDVLAAPAHLGPGGRLARFGTVVANPPFACGYRLGNLAFPERFAWGCAPETGRRADWMFAQHAAAVLEPGGRAVVLMPHGILFRGGAERGIRRRILQAGRVDAVIGLAPGLFHGTGIPVCALILNGGTPRVPGSVLFIDASREYENARAQNRLRPRHAGKIITAFADGRAVPGFARPVPLAELEDNDWNLSIRRYIDAAPPAEPQDVRAHLHGGMPEAEIRAHAGLFAACGIDVRALFGPPAATPAPGYLTFPAGWRDIPGEIPGLAAAKRTALLKAAREWCRPALRGARLGTAAPQDLAALRGSLLESFTAELGEPGALSRLQLAGAFWSWWDEILPDLRVLAAGGWTAVTRSWAGFLDGPAPADLPPRAAAGLRQLAPGPYTELETALGERTGRKTPGARLRALAVADAAARAGTGQAQAAAAEAFESRLEEHLGAAYDETARAAARRYQAWTGKYAVSLRETEAQHAQAEAQFRHWLDLLYPPPPSPQAPNPRPAQGPQAGEPARQAPDHDPGPGPAPSSPSRRR